MIPMSLFSLVRTFFIALRFGWRLPLGVLRVSSHAAIQPRFGAVAKTALFAGLRLWLLAYVWRALRVGLMEIMPGKLRTVPPIWVLAEVIRASIAGGWLYKEGAP